MVIIIIAINLGRAIDIQQLKDEIRKLNRIDKNEICRWIDEEAAIGLLFRDGSARKSTRRGVASEKAWTCKASAMSGRRSFATKEAD
jgi:hypothetical protein